MDYGLLWLTLLTVFLILRRIKKPTTEGNDDKSNQSVIFEPLWSQT